MSLPKSQMLQLEKHFHCLSSCIQRLLSRKEGKGLGAWLSIKRCPAMLLWVCACGGLCVQLPQQLCLRGGEIYEFLFSSGFLKVSNRIVCRGHILKKTKMTGSDFLVFFEVARSEIAEQCSLESCLGPTWRYSLPFHIPYPYTIWNF